LQEVDEVVMETCQSSGSWTSLEELGLRLFLLHGQQQVHPPLGVLPPSSFIGAPFSLLYVSFVTSPSNNKS
jgi:hypothetical protein